MSTGGKRPRIHSEINVNRIYISWIIDTAKILTCYGIIEGAVVQNYIIPTVIKNHKDPWDQSNLDYIPNFEDTINSVVRDNLITLTPFGCSYKTLATLQELLGATTSVSHGETTLMVRKQFNSKLTFHLYIHVPIRGAEIQITSVDGWSYGVCGIWNKFGMSSDTLGHLLKGYCKLKVGKVSGIEQRHVKLRKRIFDRIINLLVAGYIFLPELDFTYGVIECDNEQCTICQQDMAEGVNTIILKCGHQYHLDCFSGWAHEKLTEHSFIQCPLCRTEILIETKASVVIQDKTPQPGIINVDEQNL